MRRPAKRPSRAIISAMDPFAIVPTGQYEQAAKPYVHVIRDGVLCDTDTKGHATPDSRSPAEIVVDASRGFIPLWDRNVTLRWRFQLQSMAVFQQPEDAKNAIRRLLGEAILLWGDFIPVRFTERDDAWDFEVVMRAADKCSGSGCVLASAFFPDAGRHELVLYPKMFTQPRQEQIETLAHEIGHIFGLRHFFANITERQWASEIFGHHEPFSIMNYGGNSFMTDNDRSDLKRLYSMVWNGQLSNINGTPIKLVQPFSSVNGNKFAAALALASELQSPVRRADGCCCRLSKTNWQAEQG